MAPEKRHLEQHKNHYSVITCLARTVVKAHLITVITFFLTICHALHLSLQT